MDLLYRVRERGKFVYHYTRAEVAVAHILPDQKLKVGQYRKTNDPKETKDWSFAVGTNEGRDLSSYDLESLSAKVNAEIKGATNVLCFSGDRELTGDHLRDIYQRGFCRPRMWAQYAGNHTGVCLIFERSVVEEAMLRRFSSEKVYWGPIQYLNRGVVPDLNDTPYTVNVDYLERMGLIEYCRSHAATHHKRLFFEKCLDWKDEEEYRWAVFGATGEDLFVDYGSALRGVMFGADTSEEVSCEIQGLCRGRSVFFEKLQWKGCTPWYSFDLRFRER